MDSRPMAGPFRGQSGGHGCFAALGFGARLAGLYAPLGAIDVVSLSNIGRIITCCDRGFIALVKSDLDIIIVKPVTIEEKKKKARGRYDKEYVDYALFVPCHPQIWYPLRNALSK
jgi:hypothetical protein